MTAVHIHRSACEIGIFHDLNGMGTMPVVIGHLMLRLYILIQRSSEVDIYHLHAVTDSKKRFFLPDGLPDKEEFKGCSSLLFRTDLIVLLFII